MARISKTEWIIKGLEILSTEGYHAIRIDWMCDRFKITKGSFYHHFENLEDYEQHLLSYWEEVTQEGLQLALNQAETPQAKLNNMIEWVFSIPGTFEIAIRAWALHNSHVRTMLIRMERKRIKMVTEMYVQIGIERKKARELAELGHATWVGIQSCSVEGIIDGAHIRKEIDQMMRDKVRALIKK